MRVVPIFGEIVQQTGNRPLPSWWHIKVWATVCVCNSNVILVYTKIVCFIKLIQPTHISALEITSLKGNFPFDIALNLKCMKKDFHGSIGPRLRSKHENCFTVLSNHVSIMSIVQVFHFSIHLNQAVSTKTAVKISYKQEYCQFGRTFLIHIFNSIGQINRTQLNIICCVVCKYYFM